MMLSPGLHKSRFSRPRDHGHQAYGAKTSGWYHVQYTEATVREPQYGSRSTRRLSLPAIGAALHRHNSPSSRSPVLGAHWQGRVVYTSYPSEVIAMRLYRLSTSDPRAVKRCGLHLSPCVMSRCQLLYLVISFLESQTCRVHNVDRATEAEVCIAPEWVPPYEDDHTYDHAHFGHRVHVRPAQVPNPSAANRDPAQQCYTFKCRLPSADATTLIRKSRVGSSTGPIHAHSSR